MTHAFSESYLNDAKERLAIFFDYAIRVCGYTADFASMLFMHSGIAAQFEKGNPAFIAGKSGYELLIDAVSATYGTNKSLPAPDQQEGYSAAYWAGWVLAEYQWYTAYRYKDIFERISMESILEMYPLYHEMDITQFIDEMEARYDAADLGSKLKRIRESRGLSQAELAAQSGVNIRNIQMYEQEVNNIDRAQVKIVYRLAHVLGCTVEDLLDHPMQ